MKFDIKSLEGRRWLLDPDELPRVVARVLAYPTCPTPREFRESYKARLAEAKAAPDKAIRAVKGRIGVIGVHGPIDQRLSPELEKAGGTSLDEVSYAFEALMADSSVTAIVLHVDSPGGGIYGLQELSDRIYAARGDKKCYAAVDSMACSAAYWLASACETVVCTPGGDVGSVGVYCVHVDESKAMEDEGVKMTVIKAGKYKAEFMSCQPLSDDCQKHLQEMVDGDYTKFCKALARNRNCTIQDVRKNYGEGRAVGADAALAAGMCDRILSYQELMDKLTGAKDASSGGKNRMEVEELRRQHAATKRTPLLVGDQLTTRF